MLRSDDAVSGLFERVSCRAINTFDLRKNLRGSYQAIEKVSGLFRVRLIDKLFSSNSQELSLVLVAQLNSDVDERVVIVPWIVAISRLSVHERTLSLRALSLRAHNRFAEACSGTDSRRSSLFSQLRSHFLNSHFRPAIAFVLSVSLLSFICYQFSSRSFTLVLSSTESLFLCQSFSGFRVQGFKW